MQYSICEILGIFPNTVKERRLTLVQPGQPEQVDVRRRRDSPVVNGLAVSIEYRKFDPTEAQGITSRPTHRADAGVVDGYLA
jgi:hypothetical protein